MRKLWKPSEDVLLRKSYPHILTVDLAATFRTTKLSVYQRAHRLGLCKTAVFMEKALRDCGLQAVQAGAKGRFPKGHVPANKGVRRPGYAPGRMRETQFRKGQVPPNAMPLWSFRFVGGYLMLKTGALTRKPTSGWEYVHRLIFEQANGPLPGWRVARLWWKDGDHGNCSLSNLELVPSGEHVLRTTIHNFPVALKRVIFLKGALKRRIRRMEESNGEKHDGRSPQPPVRDDRSLAG